MVRSPLSLIILPMLFMGLNACQAENNRKQSTIISATTPRLEQVSLATNMGKVRQITTDDQHLYMINEHGELWQNEQKLAEHFSTKFIPIAKQGNVAMADSQGFLTLWANQQRYPSKILLSPHSGLAWDKDCVIAIQKQPQHTYPVRVCLENNQLKIQSQRPDIHALPDARPTVWQDKIALLAQPDNQTYRHGVLGDDLEARSLYVLNSQTLNSTFKPIQLSQQVFEHNQVFIDNQQIATVIAGNGHGAKLALFDVDTGKTLAESTPLPSNRWLSPFAVNGQWYAVKMPHILGNLVAYSANRQKLTEKNLTDGLSNHVMGSYDTQVAISLTDTVLIPHMGYQQISLLDKNQQLTPLNPRLPARFLRGASQGNRAFLLLDNGQVWRWQ